MAKVHRKVSFSNKVTAWTLAWLALRKELGFGTSQVHTHLGWLISPINLTRPSGTQIFGQTLVYEGVFRWDQRCSGQAEKKQIALHTVWGPYLIIWIPDPSQVRETPAWQFLNWDIGSTDSGFARFYNNMSQFLIMNIFLYVCIYPVSYICILWFCFSGEPWWIQYLWF